jgi:ATP synthase protein I
MMPNTDPQGNDAGGGHARFIGLGFAFVALLVVLAVAGLLVDRFLGTLPLFLLLGLGLGFAGALYRVYLALKNLGDG